MFMTPTLYTNDSISKIETAIVFTKEVENFEDSYFEDLPVLKESIDNIIKSLSGITIAAIENEFWLACENSDLMPRMINIFKAKF